MKLYEVLYPEQIDEGPLRNALAATMLGTAAMHNFQSQPKEPPPVVQPQQQKQAAPELEPIQPNLQKRAYPNQDEAVARIVKKYNVDPDFAGDVVEYANRYARPDFPTAKDILSIVGIESSWDPNARSGLRHDPAVGLTQIRPHAWKIDPAELEDVENQIRYSSEILHAYYKKLRNREAAIQAYNVGITDYLNGVEAPEYLGKWKHERMLYAAL